MKDTSLAVETRYISILMSCSSQERFLMGCRMYDTAKEIVKSSILAIEPNISAGDLKKKIFLRFYGQELGKKYIQKFLRETDA